MLHTRGSPYGTSHPLKTSENDCFAVDAAAEGRKNSSPERFEDSVLLDLPYSEATKTFICIFPFYCKSQSGNFFALGMKTRPLKFVDLSYNTPLLGLLIPENIHTLPCVASWNCEGEGGFLGLEF